MKKSERISAVIEEDTTDFILFHADLTLKIRDKIANYYSIDKEAVERIIENHFLYLSFIKIIFKRAVSPINIFLEVSL